MVKLKKHIDIYLFFAVIILILFGLVMIYSSSYVWAEYKFNDPFKYVKNQGLFIIIGIFLMIIVSKINYGTYKKYAFLIFILCIVL